MAGEERRISPAVLIIPVGLGLGLAAVVGLAALAAPPECTVDADCPSGYICKNGKCVKAPTPPEGPEPQARDEWDANSRLCPYCGQVYASYAILLEHIHIVHSGYPDPVEVPIF